MFTTALFAVNSNHFLFIFIARPGHPRQPFCLDAAQSRIVFSRVKASYHALGSNERWGRPALMILHQLTDELRIGANVAFLE